MILKTKLRATLLKTALQNKAKALQMLISSSPTKQTAEMLLGSMAHCALLEPDRFNSRYAEYEGHVNTSISFKNAEKTGKSPVKKMIADQARAMINTAMVYLSRNEELKQDFDNSEKESSFCAEDETYCYNARLDALSENYIFEYKTTCLPSPEKDEWLLVVQKYGYGLQMFFYYKLLKMIGREPKKGVIQIVQSTEFPYITKTFFSPVEAITSSELQLEYDTALAIIANLQEQITNEPTLIECLTTQCEQSWT